jgi:hypothetical protein
MSNINAQAGNSSSISAIIKVSDGTANLALQTNGSNAVEMLTLPLLAL